MTEVETQEKTQEQIARECAQKTSEALIRQNALPVLDVVKNKDGSDRLVARQKGRFTKTANARVLATQKSVEKILHMPDESGKTQLERIITSQAKVAEENTDARNLGAVTKFIEVTDEISGTKAAREALTRETNERAIPRVVIVAPVLLHPDVIDYDKQQREAAERAKRGPHFIDAEVVEQNSPVTTPYSGADDRRHSTAQHVGIERRKC
jgi:hypothetical protein